VTTFENERQPSSDPFEELAPIYDAVFPAVVPKYAEAHDVLLSMLPFGSGDSVHILELGCGTGELTRKLVEHFSAARISALDVSPSMLREAVRKLRPFEERVDLLQRDLTDPAWHEGFEDVDAVVAAYTLDYLPLDVHERLVSQVFDLLVPGGRFVSCEFIEPEDPRVGDVFRNLEYQLISRQVAQKRVSEENIKILVGLAESGPKHHVVRISSLLEWLRKAGFDRVDTPWRFFNFVIASGRKP